MRVISGTYRGLRLKALKGEALRPTSGLLRETLFNVLGESVRGARFLDAYAGSGAVGIEALSRGAQEVVWVEHSRAAVELIRQNLKMLGIQSGFRLLNCEVRTAIGRLEDMGEKFDFVFLDPPYGAISEYHHSLRQLGRSNILLPTSLVIAEHCRHCRLEGQYGALTRTRLLRHGDSQLGFFRQDRQP